MNVSWSIDNVPPALVLMFDSAIRAGVVLLCAAALSLVFRRASAAMRHGIWTCAVIGALAMPLLTVALPGWSVLPRAWDVGRGEIAPISTSAPTTGRTPQSPPVTMDGLATEQSAPPVNTPTPSLETASPPLSAWTLVAAAWVLGSAMALLPMLLGALSIARLRRRAHRVDDAAVRAQLDDLCASLGLSAKRIDLLAGLPGAMPMTWLSPLSLRHRLLIPADHGWSAARLRAVLLHELAHIKRRDCLTQWLAGLCCALYWFNPLAWLAARRMKFDRERACDDVVLAAGSAPDAYAGDLLHIAARHRRVAVATGPRADRSTAFSGMAGIAMARKSTLEGRLLAILDPKRSRKVLTRAMATVLLAMTAAVVIPTAMLRAADNNEEPAMPSPALQNDVDLPEIFLLAHAPDQTEASLECWGANGAITETNELTDHRLARTMVGLLMRTPRENDGKAPIALICENVTGTQDIPFAELMIRDPENHDKFIGPGGAKVKTAQWMGFLMNRPPDADVVDMRLRYSSGPWREMTPIAIEPLGGSRITDGVFLAGMGNNNEGHAFVSIVIDNATSESKQFIVEAFDAQGDKLHGRSTGSYRHEGDAHIYTFVFHESWSQVERVELRSRPIREVEFRNVSLKPGLHTEAQVTDEQADALPNQRQTQSAAPDGLETVEALLDQVDQFVREGLRTLAERYPTLRQTNDGPLAEALGRQHIGGRVAIRIGHYPGHPTKKTSSRIPHVPEDQQWGVLVFLKPVGGEIQQLATFDMYPLLGVEGQINVSAGDEQTEAALRQLLIDAQAPLRAAEQRRAEELGPVRPDAMR